MQMEQVGAILVITLPNRLDATKIAEIENQFTAAITEHKGNVLTDMSNVYFIASLALRMLLTGLKAVKPLGGEVRICGLQPQIAEIFRKSRFDTLFKIYPDRDTALANY